MRGSWGSRGAHQGRRRGGGATCGSHLDVCRTSQEAIVSPHLERVHRHLGRRGWFPCNDCGGEWRRKKESAKREQNRRCLTVSRQKPVRAFWSPLRRKRNRFREAGRRSMGSHSPNVAATISHRTSPLPHYLPTHLPVHHATDDRELTQEVDNGDPVVGAEHAGTAFR